MGIESKGIEDLSNDPVEALFSGSPRQSSLPYPKETEFRFFVGCLDDETTKLEFEALMTKSFRCQNVLKESGDLAVIDMQGTFDKDGLYHVVSRYAIIP